MDKKPEAKIASKKIELSTNACTITNPLVKVDKKLLETKKKQTVAASRIQRFWRDGRNRLKWKKTAEGLRNRQKRNFGTGVVVVMFMLQVVEYVVEWYTGISFGTVVFAVDLYLLVLVWASTLALKSTWQLIIGVMLSFLDLLFINFFVYIDTRNAFGWFIQFVNIAAMVLLYWLLKSMRTTLQHTYADIHGLSARLSAKIIAGLPILCYLAMTAISARLSRKYILDDLCHYVPGAYWDKNYTSRKSIVQGQWMNCTGSEQFDRYYPDTPNTVNEVVLEQEMTSYVANGLKYTVANNQIVELSLLLLTSQVLLRVCRLTVNDILSLRVSGWELALSVATLVRLAAIMVAGGLNLEMFKMSDYRNVLEGLFVLILSLYIVANAIVIKLVRDAAAVIRLENNPRAKRPRSKSVEIIHKRRPRQSVVQRQKLEDIV